MVTAVTTPTGRVGGTVLRALVRAGERPVALVRDPARLDADVRDAVETRTVDLFDARSLRDATVGVDALYLVWPEDFTAEDPLAEGGRARVAAVEAVTANGVGRVVFQSSVGAEVRHGAGLIDGLAAIEESLDTIEGLDVTHLRCGYFFSNLLMSAEEIRAGTLATNADPDTRQPWVDPRDVGEVGAARLLSRSWHGRRVQGVDGPEDLSWRDVAGLLSTALGHGVDLVERTDAEVEDGLRAAGLTDAAVTAVAAMTTGLREGFARETVRDVRSTTPSHLLGWAVENLRA